jgi:hypothetical protein
MMRNFQYVPNVNRIISFKMDPAQAAQKCRTASEAAVTVRFRSVRCVTMGFILKVVSALHAQMQCHFAQNAQIKKNVLSAQTLW